MRGGTEAAGGSSGPNAALEQQRSWLDRQLMASTSFARISKEGAEEEEKKAKEEEERAAKAAKAAAKVATPKSRGKIFGIFF